jgi:hypothetical protein
MAQSPQDVIVVATDVANALADIITKKKLYKQIGQKRYVQVEGWNTLGAMLGITARERDVHPIENGWEAYVELLRVSDGAIIGGASAICTRLERNWADRDEYAVRSMTVTRATGKAFRLSFSWIMSLAGYEPTPAEEMDGVVDASFTPAPKKPTNNGSKPAQKKAPEPDRFTDAQKKAVMEKFPDKVKAMKHAENMLRQSKKLTDKTPVLRVINWVSKYGHERTNGADSSLAAEVADKELFEK